MGEDTRISRREFLKWFAALSIVSAGGVGCVCVPVALYGPPPQPEYGPPPATDPPIMVEYGPPTVEAPTVVGIVYRDREGAEKELDGSTDVPHDTQFVIYFAVHMAESSQDAVSLIDAGGAGIGIETEWLGEDVLEVVLTVNLEPGADYVLEVGEGGMSVEGDPLLLTDAARAEFTTAE